MKFSLSWLKDHLDTSADMNTIVDAMTMAGLEVEEVHNPADKLRVFSVAKIVEAVQHPNADRLRVCQVDTIDGRKEIVCGAPNARAGLTTMYAPIGAYVPGLNVTLEAKPVRGVVSNGMLCSAAELETDTESDGIMELPDALAVGVSAAQALGMDDPVIDFEVTPNRPDWLGVNGIARDLAATGLGKFKDTAIAPVKGKFESTIHVATEHAQACPVFAGRVIHRVKNGPSPAWLQQKLKAIGLRPRNALVDITNYLSFDRARPLHVYDADRLSGTVRARLGKAGESFKALDGKTYNVTPEMCVIADDRAVLGLGGVMGGEDSGCTEQTVSVLIESAWFDPLRTFQTGRATGINSDAKYRFERGVDPGFVVPGLELATKLVQELCGGEPSEIMVAGAAPADPAPITFDHERIAKLAGLDVPLARSREILTALGFEASPAGAKKLLVKPPSWRRDVEGQADIVEEIARIHGYDKLPAPAPPVMTGRRPQASVGESRSRLARRALASAGYLEAITWSFCNSKAAALFGLGPNQISALTIVNPIAADLGCMRPTALPNLLRAAQKNLDRGFPDARLFEAGPAYGDEQKRTITAVWQPRPQRSWNGAAAPDLFSVKQDCLRALEAMSAPMTSLQAAPAIDPWWHPGRAGVLKIGNKVVAAFGDLHPRVLEAIGVEGPALAFEIWIDALPAPRAKPTRAKPPLEKSDLMPLSRDFAFVVEDKVAAADLVRAALGADKALIADVNLFDLYRGAGVPEGKKSLAIEVRVQPKEKTLTEDDIASLSAKIVSAVMKATGGTLRA